MFARSQHTNDLKACSLGPELSTHLRERTTSHSTACHPCLILQSARPDVAPHPALILLDVDIHLVEAGCESGRYFRFVCEDCGTILAKEFSGRNEGPGWVFLSCDCMQTSI